MVIKTAHECERQGHGSSMPTRNGVMQRQRRAWWAVAQFAGKPQLLLNSGIEHVPDRASPIHGPGRAQTTMRHMTGQRYESLRKVRPHVSRNNMAGISATRPRTIPKRGLSRLWNGDVSPAFPHGASSAGRLGGPSPARWSLSARRQWLVGEDMPQETPHQRSIRRSRTRKACRSRAYISTTIPTMSQCAIMPLTKPGARSTSVRGHRTIRQPPLSEHA